MESSPTVSRRDILKLGTTAAVDRRHWRGGGGLGPREAAAQTPKRGGIFHIRHHVQPVHFDPQQTIAFSTQWPLSYCMSRLVKVKAGPAVVPGTQPIEGDLAESWTQPNDTTYVFKLRKGVRWHPKPPVNGRELTAEDVKYTYERFLTVKGNPNRPVLEQVDKVDVLDPLTVRFVLKEPFAWFLDALASTSTWIIAKEAVEKFGDLKKPEAVVGTGPWMLERYEPGTRITYVRNPNYFVPGLPYVDGIEVSIDTDPSAAFASFITGRYDFGPEYGQVVRRSDLEVALQKIPTPADQGLHRRVRRHHLDEARSGAVQGRARAARPRHGQQLARGARDQCLVAGQGRPQPRDPRRPQGVVDPDRPAPSGRPPALRARHRGGEAPPRRGRLAQRLQDAVRDDGRLWPRLHGRRPDRAQELEGGRRRDGAQAQGVRRLRLEHALRQVRQDGGRSLRRQQRSRRATSTASSSRASPSTRAAWTTRRSRRWFACSGGPSTWPSAATSCGTCSATSPRRRTTSTAPR